MRPGTSVLVAALLAGACWPMHAHAQSGTWSQIQFTPPDPWPSGRMYFGSGRPGGHGGWDIWYADLGCPVAGEAASPGPATVRIPAVTVDAKRAEAASTVEPAPVGRGCCSSKT